MNQTTNNFTLTTNFNTSPYYDDYRANSNFYRILFRPGLAVQARELTQMQTITQKQIDRLSEHIFKEGSFVSGGQITYDTQYSFVRIRDDNYLGQEVNVTNFANTTLTGANSGVTAVVIGYTNGSEAGFPNTKTLFVKYTNSGSNNTTNVFLTGEKIDANNSYSANLISNSSCVGYGSSLTVQEGVLFAKDYLINFDTQTVIVDKYTNTANAKIGFVVSEEIVTYATDTTLNDPAQGAFNYQAPGADRLKLTATLTKVPTSNTDPNFILIYNLENGQLIQKIDKPQYSIIKEEWARRTYEESGNYVVRGLNVRLREHLKDNNGGLYSSSDGGLANTLAVGVEPGKAYVLGYDFENIVTRYINISKATDYDDIEQSTISANYGRYVYTNEVVGSWNINDGVLVSLYDQPRNAISGLNYSSAGANGNLIGTATLKSIIYESGTQGTANCQYRIYLHDVNMTGNTFNNVKSIYYNDPTYADYHADIVLNSNNEALFYETEFDVSIFKIPVSYVRSIRDSADTIDTTFTFNKRYDVSIGTGGTFSLSTGVSGEVFPFSTGVLNDTQVKTSFIVALDGAATVTLTGNASVITGQSNVNGLSTNFSTELSVGDKINVAGQVKIINQIYSANTLQVVGTFATSNSNVSISKQYYAGDVIDFAGKGATGNQRTITIASSDTANFDMKENLSGTTSASVICHINRQDAREASKTMNRDRYVKINCNTHSANNTGPWNLGIYDGWRIVEVRKDSSAFTSGSQGSDVTRYFTLDNGQRDNIYDHAQLRKLSSYTGLSATDYLLVKLDFFTHDYSQGAGYFSVDSYPIDDINGSSNTNAITTKEIPIYISTKTNINYDLRDCFDTRKSKVLTANNTTSVTTATTNPTTTNTFNVPTGGLHTPVPNENFIADLSYYLRRKDIIAIKQDGSVVAMKGNPSLVPITPKPSADSMAIASIELAPYPSLPPDIAASISRPDLSCKINKIKNRVYTMRDVGVLDQRISNLEYWVPLSLLEKSAVDMKVLDADGLDRFKNGVIVDSFSSHKIGDTLNADYRIAIDSDANELRPQFFLNDASIKLASYSGLSSNGNLLLLPFTEKSLISQTLASTTRNTASLFYSFVGVVELDPQDDFWVDTVRLPDLQINQDQNTQAWQELSDAWNSMFNNWQKNITGKKLDPDQLRKIYGEDNINIIQGKTSTGSTSTVTKVKSNMKVTTQTVTENFGDRVVDTTIIPFIRPQHIKFFAYGLKPNTKHYIYFDDEDVTDLCTQTDSNYNYSSSYTWGTGVVTDSDGSVYGRFRIPGGGDLDFGDRKFYVGTKNFKITDNITNSDSNATSTADAQFHAQGLSQEKQQTIVSTTIPQVRIDTKVKTIKNPPPVPPPPRRPPPPPPSIPRIPPPPPPPGLTCADYWDDYVATGYTDVTVLGPVVTGSSLLNRNRGCCEYFKNRMYANIDSGIAPSHDLLNLLKDVGGCLGSDEWRNIVDPIGQSFTINLPLDVEGCFLTSVDLYFESKHPTYGVVIEIREMDSSGQVLNTILPNSTVRLLSSQINTSSNASTATNIPFGSPVYVMNQKEYCLVIKPIANNPDTSVWTARLGEKDISTNARITKQPYSGVLFLSSNDRTYQPEQEEDLKFALYRAAFTVGTAGTAVFNNDAYEFLRISNTSASFGHNGEVVRGEPTLTLSSISGGTIANGNYLYGNTSLTTGQITYISGSTYRVRDVPIANNYVAGEPIIERYANGTATGVTATLSSVTKPTGELFYYQQRNLDDIRMYLKAANNTFAAGEQVIGLQSNNTAFVEEIINIYYNVSDFEPTVVDFATTNVSWKHKTTSNAYSLDSSWSRIEVNDNVEFSNERIIASKSNESTYLSGNKSLQYQVTAYSTSEYLSPMIDKNKIHTVCIGNIINNDSSGETNAAGGNTLARYITKKVTLAEGQDAEDLNIYITAYYPPSTQIKIYYKILHSEDSDSFDDVNWVEMTLDSKLVYSDIDLKTDFKEYVYKIPTANLTGINEEVEYTNSNGVTFKGFKYFAVKITLLSTNTSRVPRLADMRGLALQK